MKIVLQQTYFGRLHTSVVLQAQVKNRAIEFHLEFLLFNQKINQTNCSRISKWKKLDLQSWRRQSLEDMHLLSPFPCLQNTKENLIYFRQNHILYQFTHFKE